MVCGPMCKGGDDRQFYLKTHSERNTTVTLNLYPTYSASELLPMQQ